MTTYIDLQPDERAMAKRLANDLADVLERDGWLRSPQWRAALARVPRHHFAPSFSLPYGVGGGTFDGRPAESREQWLQALYASPDHTLLTEMDEHGVVTSSCSAPSVVARMLEELQVDDGASVLEIGTGTGWNAGLLAARLGSSTVTSIDFSADLVDHARQRLAALDLHPALAVADGYTGYPARALYDRIIATCAVRHLPLGWLAQSRAGGIILTDVRGSIGGALARIRVGPDSTAHGEFLDLPFSFMPMRGPHTPDLSPEHLGQLTGMATSPGGEQRRTELDSAVLGDEGFGFVAQLHLPGCMATPVHLVGGPEYYCLIDPTSRSWARRHSDGIVVQSGSRGLWDDLERAHAWWLAHGRPPAHQFRLTVELTGEQRVTFADDEEASWLLPLQT